MKQAVRKHSRATIQDVAEASGVSVSTVSRVLNEKDDVAPETYAKVKAIIDEGTVPQACRWCSDKYGVSDMLLALGCEVEYIGSPVSEAIKAGYTPMTW